MALAGVIRRPLSPRHPDITPTAALLCAGDPVSASAGRRTTHSRLCSRTRRGTGTSRPRTQCSPTSAVQYGRTIIVRRHSGSRTLRPSSRHKLARASAAAALTRAEPRQTLAWSCRRRLARRSCSGSRRPPRSRTATRRNTSGGTVARCKARSEGPHQRILPGRHLLLTPPSPHLGTDGLSDLSEDEDQDFMAVATAAEDELLLAQARPLDAPPPICRHCTAPRPPPLALNCRLSAPIVISLQRRPRTPPRPAHATPPPPTSPPSPFRRAAR